MGNRAVVKIEQTANDGQKFFSAALYLHWDGSPNTILALVNVANEYGLRADDYGMARLAQIMGNTIGGTLSMGLAADGYYPEWERTYIADEEWNIIADQDGYILSDWAKPSLDDLMEHFSQSDEGITVDRFQDEIKRIREANDHVFQTSNGDIHLRRTSELETDDPKCGYCTVAGGAGAWACPKHGEEANA